jgi:hypothetical protein
MLLLLGNPEVDPSFSEHNLNLIHKRFTNNFRLWAKHFDQAGMSNKVLVLRSWMDFCALNLLHPSRFEWLKDLMESNAWNIITSE